MAEELRIMENKSREDTNLSPVSKIEIYSFFDPFSNCLLYTSDAADE